MPIIHIAPTVAEPQFRVEGYYGTAPEDILIEWHKDQWKTALQVCPADTVTDVTPPHWQKGANFLLHVGDTGEQGEVFSTNGHLSPDTFERIYEHVQKSTEDTHWGISSVASVGEDQPAVLIALSKASGASVLGGMVMYATPGFLELVQQLFSRPPEAP